MSFWNWIKYRRFPLLLSAFVLTVLAALTLNVGMFLAQEKAKAEFKHHDVEGIVIKEDFARRSGKWLSGHYFTVLQEDGRKIPFALYSKWGVAQNMLIDKGMRVHICCPTPDDEGLYFVEKLSDIKELPVKTSGFTGIEGREF